MKETLDEIQSAAACLQRALASFPVTEFLEAGGPGDTQYFWELRIKLDDLARRAKSAGNSPALVSECGAVKAGSGRAQLAGARNPFVLCAGMIAETWKFLHGDFPAAKNLNAAEAAEMFWQLSRMSGAREDRVGWGNDRRSRWRRHFIAAAKLRITNPIGLDNFIGMMTEAATQKPSVGLDGEKLSEPLDLALCSPR
jgi:hypothetical protein